MGDDELMTLIAAGGAAGRDAERELCARFAPRIRLYGLRHLGDEDRARDLVQAVLLAVLGAAREGRLREAGKLDRFVLGTSRNVALRMRAREARREDAAVLEEIAVPPVETVDRAGLLRCMGGLDERARQVLSLSYVDDLAAEEIAARLATSAGNVRVVRHRAIAALRRCLEGGEARA